MKRKTFLLVIPTFFLICICIAILIHSMANPTDPADKAEPPFGDTVQEKHKTLQWKQFCGYEGTPYEFDIVPIQANDDGTVYSYDLTDDDTEKEPYITRFPGVELQSHYNRSKNAKSQSQNRCLRDMYHKLLTDDFFYSDACMTNYYVQIHRTVGMLSFSIVHYSGEDAMLGKASRRFCFNLDTENETGMSLYDMVSKQELREKAGLMLLEGNSAQGDAKTAEECLEQFFLQEDPDHDWYMTTEELCLIVYDTAEDGDTLLRIPFDRLSLKDCDEKTLQEELKPDRAAEFSYGGTQDYQLYFGFDKKATIRQESIKTELGPLTLRPYVLMADLDSKDKINQIIEDGIQSKFAHNDKYTKKGKQ